MGKEKTKNQKKLRAVSVHNAEEDYSGVPHSFVFHRGQIGKNVQQLIADVRQAMEPFTASSLKVRKNNSLKDFVAVAGPLGVTHFLIFSKTENYINFKFVRVPRGPTLHFKVTQYSLVKDVISSLKRHRMHEQQFAHPPLLVLNNFGTQGMHVKVMATMFQNMFPSINVHKVNLNTIRRCILINYNEDSQTLDFRHYSLKVVPVGMSKGVKKLLQEKFPNMNRWEDISELLVKGANLSESEAEQDGDHNITELPQAYAGRGNMKSQQSAVRLTEIGPRLTLQLVKIEEGLGDGKVLYHSFVKKTEEEILAMLSRKEKKLKLKNARKQKQEQNVQKKQQEKEENKSRSLAGMKRKRGEGDEGDSEVEDPGISGEQNPAELSEDDDAEYYRQEVGVEPDQDLFLHGRKKSFAGRKFGPPRKQFKGSKGPAKRRSDSDSRPEHHKAKFSVHKKSKFQKGQSPRPGKKGQKFDRTKEGKAAHKRPAAAQGNKRTFKKPGAFGTKGPQRGKHAKTNAGRKVGGPKGKAFKQKRKSH
ncbi:PREDICTED: suppressor of SWI4 1 homolog [Nanorana parkeri]|uniref:suppressor of SWI4 1 homolog n=1 Tax=Nanorana parkeri TaxID=125878 RepID=UPI000854E554|nr:PREDICTED: suppressor of SWI4 1 homolog [Nanorana parkeri]